MISESELDTTTSTEQFALDPKVSRKKDEHYRLNGRPPLITLESLCIGPLLAQLSSAMFGIVDTMWVSHVLGTKALASISTFTPFDGMGRAFGFFLSVSGSSRISALFGSGKGEHASQVLVDLIRVAFITGALVPGILIPCVRPAARWFGASEEIIVLGFNYISITLSSSILTQLFYAAGGFLQGEGRTLLFGICNMGSCLLNMFLLDPMFLIYTPLGIQGTAMATILADGIPMIILLTCYFCGVFSIKPKFSQFCKPFSKYTWEALGVGVSGLVAQLSFSIPGIIIQHLLGLSCLNDHDYNCTLSANSITFRIGTLSQSVCISMSNAYLPPASYSYAAKNSKRWKMLTIHAIWINSIWGIIISIITNVIPHQVSTLFSKDPEFVMWAGHFVSISNCLACLAWVKNISQSMLQSMQMGKRATILSTITQLLSLIIIAYIMYFTDKHNPARIQWCYPLSFVFGIFISIAFLVRPVYKFMKTPNVIDETPLITNSLSEQ